MFKTLSLLTLLIFSGAAYAEEKPTMIHAHSVDISYVDEDGKMVQTTISRDSDLRCRQIPLNAREFWDGSYASRDVAEIKAQEKALE